MRRALDVSHLPTYAFGSRAVTWWGMLGIVAIEGTMFALLMVTYLYFRSLAPAWPPGVLPPLLIYGTLNTIVILVSEIPNHLVKRAAKAMNIRAVQGWLVVGCLFAITFCVIRIYEFRSLNVWWDENAYGSIVWTLLGMHTVHLVTDVFDTIVLTVLMFTGPIEEKHFVDATENSSYWDFVVLVWLPIYVLIYLYPRWT